MTRTQQTIATRWQLRLSRGVQTPTATLHRHRKQAAETTKQRTEKSGQQQAHRKKNQHAHRKCANSYPDVSPARGPHFTGFLTILRRPSLFGVLLGNSFLVRVSITSRKQQARTKSRAVRARASGDCFSPGFCNKHQWFCELPSLALTYFDLSFSLVGASAEIVFTNSFF